jgi:Asp-tRNA(Asn)/Glu-tRNA(Gln) amidotransferase A subunit family amidase
VSPSKLTDLSACAVVDLLQAEDITPLDLLDALQERIDTVDCEVNALPTLCFDRARRHARDLMARPVAERGRLAGLPIPIKDLTRVAGVRTTFGSPIFADYVPEHSDVLVENLEREGGVVFAKSATPEFGAGAQHVQRGFRRHAQSLEHLPLGGGIFRWRSRGSGDRHGMGGPWIGLWRLPEEPCELLWRGGLEAQPGEGGPRSRPGRGRYPQR